MGKDYNVYSFVTKYTTIDLFSIINSHDNITNNIVSFFNYVFIHSFLLFLTTKYFTDQDEIQQRGPAIFFAVYRDPAYTAVHTAYISSLTNGRHIYVNEINILRYEI